MRWPRVSAARVTALRALGAVGASAALRGQLLQLTTMVMAVGQSQLRTSRPGGRGGALRVVRKEATCGPAPSVYLVPSALPIFLASRTSA